jgi:lipoprotein-anchoring transpeptidase ErfK/SrfK
MSNTAGGTRKGFLMHGEAKGNEKKNASEGCIVMSPQFREWIQDNGGGELTVVR